MWTLITEYILFLSPQKLTRESSYARDLLTHSSQRFKQNTIFIWIHPNFTFKNSQNEFPPPDIVMAIFPSEFHCDRDRNLAITLTCGI